MTLQRFPINTVIPQPLEGVLVPNYEDTTGLEEFESWADSYISGTTVAVVNFDTIQMTVPGYSGGPFTVIDGDVLVYAPTKSSVNPFVAANNDNKFAIANPTQAQPWGWDQSVGPWVAPS